MPAATALAQPFAAARPDIELGGERPPGLSSAMLSMRLTDSIDGMAGGELVFGAWGGAGRGLLFMDRQLFEFGKSLRVKLGDDVLFEGRVTAIGAEFLDGAPPRLCVHAEDRLQDLRMRRRSRIFERTTPGQIVRQIASDHGLQAQVGAEGPSLAVASQLNQSDLAFLTGLARGYGADLWVEGNVLHLAASRDDDPVELRHAGTLRSFEVLADLAHQRTAIVASGWDVSQRNGVSHRATDDAVRSELGSDASGASILSSAFGERVDTLAHRAPADASEARALADAAFRHAARRFVTGRGTAQTHPALRCGGRVRLAGLGPLFNGEYHVTMVEHRFDGQDGLASDFACERAGLGQP
jgi:phage protein D